MRELFSKSDDCRVLARKLQKELGNKIDFDRAITAVVSGKYLSSYRMKQENTCLMDIGYLFISNFLKMNF